MKTISLWVFYGIAIIVFSSCRKEDVSPLSCENVFLKDHTEVPLGVGDGTDLLVPSNEFFFAKNFDRITTATFFLGLLWENENQYKFEFNDQLVNYLSGKNLTIHAHCLLYPLPSISPDFLVNFQGSNGAFELMVKNYLQTTIGRYRGKIKSYDLTNELFDYNSAQTNPTWLRNRFASDQEFFDFIARCFRYAHEADPNALLFYNDYGQEFTNGNFEKGRAIFNQIMAWKREGVPIHGYGLQLHTNIYRPIEDIKSALELAVQTGLLIHISELDVSLNWADFDIPNIAGGEQGLSSFNEDLWRRQAETYKKIAQVYREVVPPAQQYGITVWGFSDEDSWLGWSRLEAGTLMKTPAERKKAFWYFLEGLSGKTFDCW